MDLAQFSIKGLTLYGVKFESTDGYSPDGRRIVKISVPEFSDHLNVNNEPMAGDILSKRALRVFKDFGFNITLMSRTRRGERWTKEDHNKAANEMEKSYSNARENAIFGSLL